MRTRHIGALEVSVVGLGCNNFGMRIDEADTTRVVDAAIDAGITYFDTADVYGGTRSEEFLGRALGAKRDQVVIATKFGMTGSPDGAHSGGSPEWVRRAVEDSLGRLGTDRIDHYQLHTPDPDVPIAETLGALHELVQEGKVRELGCSNFDAAQLDEAHGAAAELGLTPFRTVQNRYSVLHREPEAGVTDACARLGMGLVPYFPLESGLLTGKVGTDGTAPEGSRLAIMPVERRDTFVTDARLAAVERLAAYAADHDHTLLELAISWLVAQPTVVSVIAGATRPDQVEANATAAGWELTADQRAEIVALAG